MELRTARTRARNISSFLQDAAPTSVHKGSHQIYTNLNPNLNMAHMRSTKNRRDGVYTVGHFEPV
jgi:hypothetical protein